MDAPAPKRVPKRGPAATIRQLEDVRVYVVDYMNANEGKLPLQWDAARALHMDLRRMGRAWDALTVLQLLPPRPHKNKRARVPRQRSADDKQEAAPSGEELLPGPAGQILDDMREQLRGFIRRVEVASPKEKEWGTDYWMRRLAEIGQLTDQAFTLVSGQQLDTFLRTTQP